MLDVRAIKILEVEMGQPWFTVRIDKYAMG
jgi:hypothetical protein